MSTRKPEAPAGTVQQATLHDADIRSTRVDRRSFLAKAVAAGAIGVGAAMTAACPSSSSDGSDSDSDS